MRRTALFLTAIVLPFLLQSQITSNHQNQEQIFNKNDLIGLDIHQLVELGYASPDDINPHPSGDTNSGSRFDDCFDSYIPVDPSTYTPVPRNDDGSLFIPNLGFVFSFCGTSYTDAYILTNGALSFGAAVPGFGINGFPINDPMVAPFWADVDTRNTACGQAWYRLFPNYMIVTWEDVGWWDQNCTPVNSFQAIISDGTAPIIGIGNNIQFRYGDMEWTTGEANGGGPFGGTPATVGYNSGDNVNYEQVGRFNVDGSNYDGPEGAFDGVHWLDFKCFAFDASGGGFTLTCNDITRSLDGSCNTTITVDDVATSISSGCSAVDLSISQSNFNCDNVGPNVITVTATSSGQTETCTAIVTITEGLCSAPAINPIGPLCEDDFPTTLIASPPGGSWGGAAPSGVFDPSITGPGLHTVTYTSLNSCPTMTSINVFVNGAPDVTITPDPPEFCEDDGGIPLTANATGGDGNYTFEWTTPIGNQSGQIIPATFPGIYTVSVTDGNGCTSLEFTNVVVNPNPDVSITGPFTACNTEVAVQLQANPPGGVWTGVFVSPEGFIFPQSMPLGATQVTYSYTNNFFCESSVTADITILPSPDADAFNNGPYCEGQNIELFGNTNSSGTILYNWTGPNGYSSTMQNPTNATEPGAYTLEVTANGCSSEIANTIVEVVAAPDAIASNTGPYCPGQTISLIGNTLQSGTIITYEWSGPNSYISLDQNPTNATLDGLYTLIVTVDGCPSEATATLVDFTDAPDALAENTGPYCMDDPITLIGSTTSSGTVITYSWSGPSGYTSVLQNPTDAIEPGTYTLEILVDGCQSDPSTTEIIINPLPEPIITGDALFCDGASSTLDAGSGYATYVWSTGGIMQSTLAEETGVYAVTVSDANGCTGETTFTVTENPNPVPTITGSTSFCTGSATLLDAGGGYNIYEWSNGLFTQSIDVSEPGDYSVIVTDANGCTGTTSVTVIENDVLLPSITGDLDLCEGESSILDAGDGYETYIWSTGAITSEIDASTTGNYSVTVTDINGCTGENMVSLTINTNPLPTIEGDITFCEGASASISADGPYDAYIWSEGSTSQTISVDATGTYFVTVTDVNGCTGETSFDVTENPNPEPSITGSTSFCTGNSTLLDAGDGYDIYEWSNGLLTQSIDVSEPGDYSVIVTDANGCTGTTSVTIIENDLLLPSITGDLDLCEGESSILDAGDGYETYIWSTGAITSEIDASTTGDYSVTVTDINGCTGETSVSLLINTNPTPTIDGDAAFCEGASVSLNADGPYDEYAWSEGSVSQTISIDATGTYFVTVTDTNGCTGETSFDVIENPNPEPSITGDASFCSGSSATISGDGGYTSYVWSEGSETQSISVTEGNTYSLTVTDANGCTGETQFTVDESIIQIPEINGTLEFCEGSSTLDAGDNYNSYIWSDGSIDQTITVDETGTYSVTVSDINGCTAEDEVDVIVFDNPMPEITGTTAFCEGDVSTLNAGTGYTDYLWSDGSIDQFFEVSESGTYSVTITDSNGCTGETDVNITINPNPTPTIAGSTTFCSGFSTILDASDDYETYLWSDGSENSTLEVSVGDTYSVIVTDANGCTGETSIDVTESTSLNPVISGDIEYCTGSNTILDAGAGFETYEWSNGSLEQTITVDNPNDYTVTVTDVNGCSGETTVSIIENPLPSLNITGNNPICTGDMISLDAGAGFESYEWSDLSLNQNIDVSLGGNYSVTVTDANGCTNEAAVVVIENPLPTPTITGNQSFCTGETVTLNTGAFDQYLWSDGSELSSLDITIGGTYSVTVTDINGCTGEDQITVSENQLPTPQISGELAFCSGNTTTISGPDGFDYLWSTGEITQSIIVSTGGDVGLIVTDAFGCTGETSVSLTENPNPDPVIAGSATFCIGNSSIIDAGNGYEEYIWSDGSLNQTLEVTVEGTYMVTVTDTNGCTGVAQFDVTESSSLEPIIIGDSDICAGETSTLDAGAGFDSYIWSNGAETQSIEVDLTGDYSVTVSDVQGCTGENMLSLTVNQNPSATIDGLDNICEGEISSLDAGNGYDSYQWSNGETTQIIEVTSTGIYSVIVTDSNGCQDETQIDIIVNPNPSPIIVGPSSFCSGNSATLDAGSGYDSYLWSNGETSQMISVTAGNTYSVVVSTLAGCTGTSELMVTENSSLSPVVLGDLEFCTGDNSILDAGSGYATYEWSNGETSQTITVSEGGNYGVLVTDADGCSGSSNVSVSLFDNPEPIIAGSSTFCTGTFTTLDAGNYSSFLWSNGEISQTITVSTPGSYSVEVTDANGCSGIAFVDVTESTSLNPVISGEPAICTGGTTILDAGAGFETYMWSDGSINQTLEISAASDYTVTVSDAQGCTGETTISVIENIPPSAELVTGPELCNTEAGGSITNLYDLIISGDTNGTWEDTDGSGALGLFDNLNFNGIVAGDYTFTYTTNSAISPCDEVSYTVLVSILDCACPGVSFIAADPLCNGDETIALNTIVNSSETGTWQIITSPTGSNPAVLNGDLFDATAADIGTYELEFTMLDMPPPGCPQTFFTTIEVESEVFAGIATSPSAFCADESQVVTLNDLLDGEETNGTWTETSGTPSQNGAFDSANGSFDMTGQANGIYTFEYTVTSTGACPNDSEVVTVIVNESPIAIAGSGIELSCSDPELSLNAIGSSSGPDFDIQWSGGVVIDGNENSISPTVNQAGIYTLVVTNNTTGCSATDVVEVTESADVPNAFAGNDDELTCDEEELSLQASGDIGNGFEIEWSGPSITAANMNEVNPMISLAGIYTLMITNTSNGCVSSIDTVIISNNDQAPDLVIQTPLSIDCNNTDIEIVGSSPVTGVSYEWFFGGNSIGTEASVSEIETPGLYTLVVTNNLTGCSGSETIEVFENTIPPNANAGLPQLLNCYNTSVSLDGSNSQNGASINWSGPGIVGSSTIEIINVNLPGTYTITVQDLDNGCENTAVVEVDQDITPPIAIIAQPEQLDCMVEEVSLDGSASSSGNGFNYSWIDPQGNILSSEISTEAQSTGSYILAVQDINNGCVDTALVLVTQNMDVPTSALFQINNPDCFGDDDGSIAIGAVNGGMAPYVYSINDEVFTTNGFYSQLPPGPYEISLQDANGCEWDTLINITEPIEAEISLGDNLNLELGDSATISVDLNIPIENVDTIIWSPADLIECGDPDCLEVGFSSFLTQEVSATLIDINGCIDEDNITVVMNRDKRVFIPNAFSPNGDGQNDELYIFADDEQVVEVKKFMIFNRWGELVYEGFNFQPNDPEYGWNGSFRGEMMNPAVFVYLAEIEFIDGEVILYKGDITLH